MRSLFHTFRAVVATGLSLWMAVLACLVGCTVPALANSGPMAATSNKTPSVSAAPSLYVAPTQENAADQTQSASMADMENCPHHSGSHSGRNSSNNAPAKPNGPKPVPGGRMSCCPVEVTVASKPTTATQRIESASDFVLESNFTLTTTRFFHSVEFVPPVRHSGRDTLLETHLLRV
jgi:hypothetical protein